MFADYYEKYSSEFIATLQSLDFSTINEILEHMELARKRDNQVFVIGNGGSAASASHWICDFGKGVNVEGCKRFRIISLADQMTWTTALGNDISYDDIFVEPLKNWLREGDLLIGLSVSGNSENVVKAFQFVKENGGKTIALIGNSGGRLKSLSDISLLIPSGDYGIVEDVHMFVNHVISQFMKKHDQERGNRKGLTN